MRSMQQQLVESWEPSQHSLLDRRKPRKTCVEVAGRRTFRILTSSQHSATKAPPDLLQGRESRYLLNRGLVCSRDGPVVVEKRKLSCPCRFSKFGSSNSYHNRQRRSRRGVNYSSTLSLTSALDGGGWSTSRPGHFTPGKDPVPILQEAVWAPGPSQNAQTCKFCLYIW